MNELFNIYCDESCHLENDHQKVMVLGAVWCPAEKARDINRDIRGLKESHGLKKDCEIKWTKVSPGQIGFYEALLGYFFANADLHFRSLIVPDKSKLRHEAFGQTHDDWYYKMYFSMLKAILSPDARYRIFLDIKDTRSAAKVIKLHEVLTNNMYDFSRSIVETVQNVRSHEVEVLQLCDLLIGAISYVNRELTSSAAKLQLVDQMRQRSGYRLTRTTLLREAKVNLLRWSPEEPES
jgi:hypothetical protein